MANTYTIREVTVTIPKIGIVSSDKEGNEFKCGEIYRINIFAVRPGLSNRFSDFEGLIVGRLDFSGYSESQFSRTQKVIMPNGYELVALRVGECGRPMTRESLPVAFSDAPLSDNETFTVKNGEVFIKDIFIGDSTGCSVKLNINYKGKQYAAGMVAGINAQKHKNVMASMKPELGDDITQAVIDAVSGSDLFTSLQITAINGDGPRIASLTQDIHCAISDAIRASLKPGGAIWTQLRGLR